jgi:hypothetical protein
MSIAFHPWHFEQARTCIQLAAQEATHPVEIAS